jgi:predicted TIM-barrel fold metal-dependent hydrolase
MIIDCYVSCAEKPLAGKVFGLAELDRMLREARVDKAVCTPDVAVRPGNRELADALAARPEARGFLYGCAFLNPHFGDDSVRELETSVREHGFRGLKLMPTHHAFRCVTQVPHALMRKAGELGIPVLIHSGTFFAHPLEISVLAEAFPTVPVLMDHMGYRYYVQEAIAAARRAPNIHLVTSIVMYPHWIRQAVKELGGDRVMFASNAPLCYPATQLLVINQAELSERDERKVLGENAARLFNLG